MYAEGNTIADGPNPKFTAESVGAAMFVFNSGALSNASGALGRVAEYLP
jgi:hypothetical protein